MKKIFAILAAAVFLAACSDSAEKNAANTADAITAAAGTQSVHSETSAETTAAEPDKEASVQPLPEGFVPSEAMDCEVKYIRTNGYADCEEYPKTYWIESAAELEEYYENNKDKYFLERVPEPYPDGSGGFLDAADGYDDAFFKEHNLIIILLEEPSGSIRHSAELRFGLSMYDRAPYNLIPVIKREVPEVCTADMAEWHIIFEVDKKYSPMSCILQNPSLSDGSG